MHGLTKAALVAEVERLRAALTEIVEVGTRRTTVRVGDMYDEVGGYDDYETVSEEAEIARSALRARAHQETSNDG